ncbi:MAG: serine/threonine-protein phosphatase [Clostridia bacterium]|nr:serine/threonine-protein phosphatase [Clostridia bacterium]
MENGFAVSAAAASHRGLVRSKNEDNLYFNGKMMPAKKGEKDFFSFTMDETEEPCVFAVFDGMGGLKKGHEASRVCAEAFKDSQKKVAEEDNNMEQTLLDRINTANENLCAVMKKNGQRMGSTVAALAVKKEGIAIANIGDSRVYRVKEDGLRQLSVDHNEAEYLIENGMLSENQALKHPSRNRLTQHVGISPDELVIYPSSNSFPSRANNEKYLLCSDGLYSMLGEEKIFEIISENEDLEHTVKKLCDEAVKAGGKDNITAVLINILNDNFTEEAFEEDQKTLHSEKAPSFGRTLMLYIIRLFDIRKKGQGSYPLTPRLIMGRFIFACAFISVLMCIFSAILRHLAG